MKKLFIAMSIVAFGFASCGDASGDASGDEKKRRRIEQKLGRNVQMSRRC